MGVLKSKSNIKSWGIIFISHNGRKFLELRFGKVTWLLGF